MTHSDGDRLYCALMSRALSRVRSSRDALGGDVCLVGDAAAVQSWRHAQAAAAHAVAQWLARYGAAAP
jgi:hypothetical protein